MPATYSALQISTRQVGVAEVAMARPAVFDALDGTRIADLDDVDAALDPTVAASLAAGPEVQHELKQLFARLSSGPAGPVATEVSELCAQTAARVRGSAEAHEGCAACLGKRPASWIGVP